MGKRKQKKERPTSVFWKQNEIYFSGLQNLGNTFSIYSIEYTCNNLYSESRIIVTAHDNKLIKEETLTQNEKTATHNK